MDVSRKHQAFPKFQNNMMLFLIIFIVAQTALGTVRCDAKVEGIVDDFINKTLNDLIGKFEDPLVIDSSYQRFNNVILTGWLNVSRFEFSGLKSVVASYIDVKYNPVAASSINLTLTIGQLDLLTDYETSLILGQLVPFFGRGNFSFHLDTVNVNLFTVADVVLIPTSIGGFKNTTVSFSIGPNTSAHIEGAFGDDDISNAIDDLIDEYLSKIIEYVDRNQEAISEIISPLLQSLLDDLFG